MRKNIKKMTVWVLLWGTKYDDLFDNGVSLFRTKDEAVAKMKDYYDSSLASMAEYCQEEGTFDFDYDESYPCYFIHNDKAEAWERAEVIMKSV